MEDFEMLDVANDDKNRMTEELEKKEEIEKKTSDEDEKPRRLLVEYNESEIEIKNIDVDSWVYSVLMGGSKVLENGEPYKFNVDKLIEKAREIVNSNDFDLVKFHDTVSIAFAAMYDEVLEKLGFKKTNKHSYQEDNSKICVGFPNQNDLIILLKLSCYCPRIPTDYSIDKLEYPEIRQEVVDGLIRLKEVFQNLDFQKIQEEVAKKEKIEDVEKTSDDKKGETVVINGIKAEITEGDPLKFLYSCYESGRSVTLPNGEPYFTADRCLWMLKKSIIGEGISLDRFQRLSSITFGCLVDDVCRQVGMKIPHRCKDYYNYTSKICMGFKTRHDGLKFIDLSSDCPRWYPDGQSCYLASKTKRVQVIRDLASLQEILKNLDFEAIRLEIQKELMEEEQKIDK